MPGPGTSAQLGASIIAGGVNFSLFSRTATGVELLLFDREDHPRPARVFALDPVENHTYHYWHAFVPDVAAGQLYGYHVAGPQKPERGQRFDPGKVLLDPYGRGVAVPRGYDRVAAGRPGDNAPTAMKSVVVDPSTYDWEGDQRCGSRHGRFRSPHGISKNWRPGTTLGFTLLVSTVVWVVLDLNQPRQGTITFSQEPLERLLKGMEPDATTLARATTGN